MAEYKCLVFNYESIAIHNQKIIWVNYVTQVAESELFLLRFNGEPIPTLQAFEALTEAEKASCQIAGKMKGLAVECGITFAFALVREIYEQEIWWIRKPDAPALMAGVANYVEADYSPSWFPPIEES